MSAAAMVLEDKGHRGGHGEEPRVADEPDPRYCNAKKRDGSGGRCKQPAGHGVPGVKTGVCSKHGGKTRSHKALAEKVAMATKIIEARKACSLLGLDVPVEGDPAVVLLLEMERAEKAVEHWGSQVALLAAAGEEVGKDTPALALWMIERKTVADVSAKAQALGIARRRMELDEDLARLIMSGFSHFARLAGLDPDAPAVRRAGREALQLVAGGAV